MIIAKTRAEVRQHTEGKRVGFVPTMGALHIGHGTLVTSSKDAGHYTVVCIFINPSQFNNPSDFENYPIRLEDDIAYLESIGCDLIFTPSVDEVYRPEDDKEFYIHNFGLLETGFEGEFRPGHFQGVGQVIHILFEIVNPVAAYFGEKDIQQLAIVQALNVKLGSKVEVVGVETKREKSGLAMSSRNLRLTAAQLQKAPLIYECLIMARQGYRAKDIALLKAQIRDKFESDSEWNLEYFELIDPNTFEPISHWSEPCRAIVAAHLGEIRLIDNISIS